MREVAEKLSVPQTYAYELARRRELPAIKLGKYVRVRGGDFEEWMETLDQVSNVDSGIGLDVSATALFGPTLP